MTRKTTLKVYNSTTRNSLTRYFFEKTFFFYMVSGRWYREAMFHGPVNFEIT